MQANDAAAAERQRVALARRARELHGRPRTGAAPRSRSSAGSRQPRARRPARPRASCRPRARSPPSARARSRLEEIGRALPGSARAPRRRACPRRAAPCAARSMAVSTCAASVTRTVPMRSRRSCGQVTRLAARRLPSSAADDRAGRRRRRPALGRIAPSSSVRTPARSSARPSCRLARQIDLARTAGSARGAVLGARSRSRVSTGSRDDLGDRRFVVGQPIDEGCIGAVLEQAAHEISEQVLVRRRRAHRCGTARPMPRRRSRPRRALRPCRAGAGTRTRLARRRRARRRWRARCGWRTADRTPRARLSSRRTHAR